MGSMEPTSLHVRQQAASTGTGAGLLQKLGRVLREKASTDLDRILHGASKTREKLGVCRAPSCLAPA